MQAQRQHGVWQALWGLEFKLEIGRIEHGFRERPDLCAVDCNESPREQMKRFYFDTLVHDEAALRYLIESVGAARLALGSDYPFPLGERVAGTLIRSMHGISDADQRGILAGGNLEYLKLGASHMLTGYDHLLFLFGVMFFLTR